MSDKKWIKHNGGECPVSSFTGLVLLTRDGSLISHLLGDPANEPWEWPESSDRSFDIVAYYVSDFA